MPRINMFGSENKGLSVNINDQANENCYMVPNYGGRNTVALVGSMGSAEFTSTSMGVCRGAHPDQIGSFAYFVSGQSIYRVNDAGAAIDLGTIPGAGRVSIVFDGTNLIVFNGTATGYYLNTSTNTLSTVALPAVAYTGTTLDGFIIFSSDNQRWYVSTVNDSDNWDALDFASAGKSPDDLVAIWEDHSELILFGEKTIEPWFNGGEVDFTFSQNTAGIIERGLGARFSVAKEDNTLFFVGEDALVYRMQGYQAARISDEGVETTLSDIAAQGQLNTCFAFTYVEHGAKFYQLTFPNVVTLVYNIQTGEWHTLKHWQLETHHAQAYCRAFNKHLIGTTFGKVYELNRSYYSDGDQPLRRLRRTAVVSSDDRLINWKKIKFIMEYGTTPVLTGQGSDPLMVVRWSDNFGRTFSNERHLSLGSTGDYEAKAIARNCGKSRARMFEFYVTDPVPFILIDVIGEFS